jgi:hypothetical protein
VEALDGFRAAYAGLKGQEAHTIVRLVDEIEVLDRLLSESEDEVARLRRLVEPKAPSASVSKTASGKWAVRWREDGQQRSQSFEHRQQAEGFRAALRGRWFGGAL